MAERRLGQRLRPGGRRCSSTARASASAASTASGTSTTRSCCCFNAHDEPIEFATPPGRVRREVGDGHRHRRAVAGAPGGRRGRQQAPRAGPVARRAGPDGLNARPPQHVPGPGAARLRPRRPPPSSPTTWPTSASPTSTPRRCWPPRPAPTHGYDVVDHSPGQPGARRRGGPAGAGRGAARGRARPGRRHRAQPRRRRASRRQPGVVGRADARPGVARTRTGSTSTGRAAGCCCRCSADDRTPLDELRVEDGELRYYDTALPDRRRHRRRRPRARCTTGSTTSWSTGAAATRELNYRRFFAIVDLAGLRVEDPDGVRRHPRRDPALVRRRATCRASGSTTRTACATRAGTCDRLRDRPRRTPGWWSRRSSSRARSCRPGRSTAPPATTRSPRSAASSSTRGRRARSPTLDHHLTGGADRPGRTWSTPAKLEVATTAARRRAGPAGPARAGDRRRRRGRAGRAGRLLPGLPLLPARSAPGTWPRRGPRPAAAGPS